MRRTSWVGNVEEHKRGTYFNDWPPAVGGLANALFSEV
jgi:hypothetical protein